MGNVSKFYNGEKEDGKKPSESKEEHDTADAEHHTQDRSCTDSLLLSSNSAAFVSNQHNNDPDKDEEVEEHYGEDGSEKGAPKYFSVRDETAVIKLKKIIVHNYGMQAYSIKGPCQWKFEQTS